MSLALQVMGMSAIDSNVSLTVSCDTCLLFISSRLSLPRQFLTPNPRTASFFCLFLFNTHFPTLQDSHRFGAQISKALKDVMRILSADAKAALSSKGKKLL